MHRRRWLVVAGAALTALMLAAAVSATAVFAQEPDPETNPEADTEAPALGPFGGFRGGHGGPGMEMLPGGGVSWDRFDAIAEALGMEPDELFAELHNGKTIDEIAEAKGVDLDALREEWAADQAAARDQAMRDWIAQAVEDGTISQDQATWLLQGLDNGYLDGLQGLLGRHPGHGMRGHGGFGRFPVSPPAEEDAQTTGTSA